ncbi:MAG: hypothetical protein RMM58_10445 [Chloroflexota bacterium]|nr:hypothetical protein [Dehalococcoidia bacterium]MDW8254284.1 hypothetical protein [Chloroflexota bacterium]
MALDYQLLKALHILLVIIWLGTDIATMASFYGMLNSRYHITTRLAMSRLSDLMDMGPRSALVLLLMLGIYLTYRGEWGLEGPVGEAIAVASAVIGVLWFAGVWHQYWVTHGHIAGSRHAAFQQFFRRFDLGWRVLVSGALAVAAVFSLFVPGAPFNALWLSLKLILFAGIVLIGVYLRVLLPQIGAAVGEIVKYGSTPEREAVLWKPSLRAIVSVWGIWVLIAAIVYLAVAKI